MSALQEFNKLFKELQHAVEILKKTEAKTIQDIKTLEARKAFLEDSIDQANERRKQQEAKHDQVVLSEGVELDIIKAAQEEARRELDKVNAEIEASQLIAQQNVENIQTRVNQLQNELTAKQKQLTDLEIEYEKAEAILDEYNDQIQEKDGLMAELEAKIANKKAEVDQAYSALDTEQKLIARRQQAIQAD